MSNNNNNRQNKKRRPVLRPYRRTKKKLLNKKVMVIPIVIGALARLLEEVGRTGLQRASRDRPIVNISHNTEESPGELRRFAITQSLVKNHQLMFV